MKPRLRFVDTFLLCYHVVMSSSHWHDKQYVIVVINIQRVTRGRDTSVTNWVHLLYTLFLMVYFCILLIFRSQSCTKTYDDSDQSSCKRSRTESSPNHESKINFNDEDRKRRQVCVFSVFYFIKIYYFCYKLQIENRVIILIINTK